MPSRTAFVVVALSLAAASGHADGLVFKADLRGDQEVPVPVVTEASGKAIIRANVAQTELVISLSIKNGDGVLGAAGAHIHCAPAGQNGPVVVFLAGVLPGGVNGSVDLRFTATSGNIVNPACGASIAELLQAFAGGLAYVNVHSLSNPSGVIRGQLHQNQGGN